MERISPKGLTEKGTEKQAISYKIAMVLLDGFL